MPPFWVNVASSMSSRMTNRVVSSAKSLTLDSTTSGRSFIYIKNKRGPRTEHWGTPALILPQDEDTPCRTTCWVCLRGNLQAIISYP